MMTLLKNKKLYQLTLLIIGLTMLFAYIWLRFIRPRLPKEIPFNLSILGFVLLVNICFVFLYLIISLITKDKPINPFIKSLLDLIYIPLKTLDHFLKNIGYIQKNYKYVIVYITNKLEFCIVKTNIFYYIFIIMPRCILLIILFIDIFWFHQLYYIYKVVLIGIFILLGKYIIYSLKYAKEQFILQMEPFLYHTITEYVEGVIKKVEDPDEDEDENGAEETMCLSLKELIEFETFFFVNNGYIQKYNVISNNNYKSFFKKKHGIPLEQELTKEERKLLFSTMENKITNIINISILITYYNMTNTSNKTIKKLKIFLFINYFLCWLYILIISLHTLHYTARDIYILFTIFSIQDIEDPFSLTKITSYLFC
jgi:hypothetical protein